MYAIVHVAQKYSPIETIQKNTVQYFTLGNLKTHVFILDIELALSLSSLMLTELEKQRIGT